MFSTEAVSGEVVYPQSLDTKSFNNMYQGATARSLYRRRSTCYKWRSHRNPSAERSPTVSGSNTRRCSYSAKQLMSKYLMSASKLQVAYRDVMHLAIGNIVSVPGMDPSLHLLSLCLTTTIDRKAEVGNLFVSQQLSGRLWMSSGWMSSGWMLSG